MKQQNGGHVAEKARVCGDGDCDQHQTQTPVNRMFDGRSVFITGASGFIGRVLLEKLLRCYQGIKNIYILMRSKKNLSPQERLNKQLLKVPIFDKIRSMKNGQELLDKIIVVTGDIGETHLGLSDSDLNMMLNDETLSIVFHSAATVKFDEPLQTSVRFNLQATEEVISLCHKLPNLLALCHVSTAYANSHMKDGQPIEEKIYPIRETPNQVIKLAQLLEPDMLQQIRSSLVADRPNTYTYTKALAEHLIALEASDLPVAIVRPSIVVSAWKEPIPGWVDNMNGPTGLILAIGKGLLRSMVAIRGNKADIIPVDIVVNTMIAAAFYAAKSRGKLAFLDLAPVDPAEQPEEIITSEKEQQLENRTATTQEVPQTNGDQVMSASGDKRVPPIFHCCSGDTNPIHWGTIESFFPIIRRYPSRQVFRYPFGTFKQDKYVDMVTRLIVHYLPALIIDLVCLIMGKKRQLMTIYYKLQCAVGVLTHFCTTNYNFKSNNMKLLEEILSHPEDKRQLYIDISTLDWAEFWKTYVLGARRHVLKEDDNSLEEARQSFRRAWYLEMAFRTLLMIFAVTMFAPSILRTAAPILSSVPNLIQV